MMKKPFRIIAVLIAVVMLVPTIPVAFAKDVTPYYWNTSSQYFSVCDEQVRSGNYALKLIGVPAGGGVHYMINTSVSGAEADTYTLTFYSHGGYRASCNFKLEFSNGSTGADQNLDFNWNNVAQDQGDGWYKVTKTYTIPDGYKATKFYFEAFPERGVTVYIDDMTLTNSQGENILKNGDFEEYVKQNTITPGTHPKDYTFSKDGNATEDTLAKSFVVQNDLACDGNNSIVMTANINGDNNERYYMNPTLVPNAPSGDWTFSFKSMTKFNHSNFEGLVTLCDTDNSIFIEKNVGYIQPVSGPDSKGWYTYELTGTSAKALKAIQFMVYRAIAPIYLDDFKLTVAGDTTNTNYIKNGSFEQTPLKNTIKPGTLPVGYDIMYLGNASASLNRTIYSVVNDTFVSAGNSLKIHNIGVLPNEQYYLTPQLDGELEAGDYTFTMRIKGNPSTILGSILYLWDENNAKVLECDLKWDYSESNKTKYNMTKELMPDGWYLYTFKLKSESKPIKFQFNVYESSGEYYFDDLCLTNDADATQKNLIINGNFDTNDTKAPADVTGISVVNKNNGAQISWVNPAKGYCARVYAGEDILTTVYFDNNIADITDLENGKEYKLVIKTVNDFGYESDGVEVKVNPYLPDTEVFAPQLADSKTTIIPGTNTISATVANHKLEKYPAILMAALYKGDTLEKIDLSEPVNLAMGENATLTASVNVPNEFADCKLKAFLLSDLKTLKPIISSVEFLPDAEFVPKKVLTQDELIALMSGYSKLTVDSDGYIDSERFTTDQKAFYQNSGFSVPANVRLSMISFETDSQMFWFDYKLGTTKSGDLDIYVDGEYKYGVNVSLMPADGPFSYALDGQKHRIDIYLPQNGLTIKNFAVSENATITPITGRTKAMFFGDSITQGVGIFKASQNYVSKFARINDYEFVNYGVSGYNFNPNQVKANTVFTPDVIFIAYGTNDATMASTTEFETVFTTRVTQFMDNLTALYPTQTIYLITPLWTNWSDRAHNIDASRRIIAEVAENYENAVVINGLDMIPAQQQYYTDSLHPNADGATLYAQNLANAIK